MNRVPLSREEFLARLSAATMQIDHHGGELGLIFLSVDNLPAPHSAIAREGRALFFDHLGNHLARNVRAQDLLGRRGEDEFALMSPGLDLSEATGCAVKLRRLVEEYRLNAMGIVSASLGVTSYYRGEGTTALEMRVIGAAHRARASGGNRITAVRAAPVLQ